MVPDSDKAFLYGVCWGDGCITKSGFLKISHSAKQADYLTWKVDNLSRILGCESWIEFYLAKCKGKEYPACQWYSPVSDELKSLREFLYPLGEKRVSREFLSYMNVQSLAILHMDDGHLYLRKRGIKKNGEPYIRERQVELNLYVSLEEAILISDRIFELTNARFKPRQPNKKGCPDSYNLRCEGTNCRKFIQSIEKYKIPPMEYKFALQYDKNSHRGKASWSEADLHKYVEADKGTRARNI